MAEITDVLSSPYPFHPGYADSLEVTPDRLYVREDNGWSRYGHGANPQYVMSVDLNSNPAFKKVGDGFQLVTNLGCSEDGTRMAVGYKQDDHGTLVFQERKGGDPRNAPDDKILGEFGGPRATGGVVLTKVGGRLFGYALGFGLVRSDVTTPATKGRTPSELVAGAPSGFNLLRLSPGVVVYVAQPGRLVVVNGVAAHVTDAQAVCLAVENGQLLRGVFNGMQRDGQAVIPLPESPGAVCLLGGVAYAWTVREGRQRLFREAEEILTLPELEWGVKVCKGFGSYLYAGTRQHTLVVRVS